MKNTRANKVNTVLLILIAMTGIHLINNFLNGQFLQYGIYPRDIDRWYHVFTAPFIHGNWGHLLNNLVGLAVFSFLCMLRSVNYFIKASVFINLVTGCLVWLFARPAIHLGASGWVFGLWSLLIVTAWFDRRFSNLLIAVFVVLFYGGMIYGILPGERGISFESHLFGALAGLLFVSMTHKKRK